MVEGCWMQMGELTSTQGSGQLQLSHEAPEQHPEVQDDPQVQVEATRATNRRARKIFFI